MKRFDGQPVKWTLQIPVEVQCEYAGIAQCQYYTDLEKTIEVCATYPDRFAAATGYRPSMSYSPSVTSYEGVAALGGELVFPRAHQPMIRNQGHILETAEAVHRLTVPDPWASARFLTKVEEHRELKRHFGEQAGGNWPAKKVR